VQIYQALNIDRKTIRKYLAPALAEGLQPTPDEMFDEEAWRARIQRWFPELVDPTARALTWPQIAAHHQVLADQLFPFRGRGGHGVTGNVGRHRRQVTGDYGVAIPVAQRERVAALGEA
jgi:hypothetical protein